MKNILRTEEAAQFIASIYFFSLLPYKWWLYPACILLPDIGIAGYLINNAFGAFCYNFFHHKGIAIGLAVAGIYFNSRELLLTGIIFFGHSSMDRMLDYGLKYPDNFKHTHLGWMK